MAIPGTQVDALLQGPTLVGNESIPGMRSGIAYRWTPSQFAAYAATEWAGGLSPQAHQALIISDSTGLPVWQNQYIPVTNKSASYTFVLGDGGFMFVHPSADTTARSWTIPANAAVAYRIGTTLTFYNQNGAGVLTIGINSDTLRLVGDGTTGSRLLAANGMATAVKVAATEWVINGVGLT